MEDFWIRKILNYENWLKIHIPRKVLQRWTIPAKMDGKSTVAWLPLAQSLDYYILHVYSDLAAAQRALFCYSRAAGGCSGVHGTIMKILTQRIWVYFTARTLKVWSSVQFASMWLSMWSHRGRGQFAWMWVWMWTSVGQPYNKRSCNGNHTRFGIGSYHRNCTRRRCSALHRCLAERGSLATFPFLR